MRSNSVIWDFFWKMSGRSETESNVLSLTEVIDLGFQECWDHQSDGTVTGQTKLAHWSPPQCSDHWSVTHNTQKIQGRPCGAFKHEYYLTL